MEMAMSMLLSFAPSIRLNTRRWPASSTTAMSIGTPIDAALRAAAAMIRRAPCRLSRGVFRIT